MIAGFPCGPAGGGAKTEGFSVPDASIVQAVQFLSFIHPRVTGEKTGRAKLRDSDKKFDAHAAEPMPTPFVDSRVLG